MAVQPHPAGVATTNVFGEHLYKVRVTFGSNAIASYLSKDVTIARANTGQYTVTFPKYHTALTDFSFGMKDATGATLNFVVSADNLASAGTLTVEAHVAAGTATDPASGDVAYLTFGVSDDNLNAKYGG